MGLDGTTAHTIWVTALLVGGGAFGASFVVELDETRVATEDRHARDQLALRSAFEVVQAALDHAAGTVRLQLANTGRSVLDPALVTVLFDGTPRAVSGVETGGTGGSRVWAPGTHANLTVVSEWAPRRVAATEAFGHTRVWDNPEPPYFVAIDVTPDPADVEFQATQQFTASGYDQYGEPTTTASATWTTDVVGSSIDPTTGLFTAGTTEDCGTVAATSASVADSATVCVYREPAELTAIVVSPDPASVEFQATQQFTAACTDQYGLAMTCPSLAWSTTVAGASIDASTGLFTAGTTEGSGSVTAAQGAVSDAASVSVYRNAAVLTAIALSPDPASVEFQDTQQFTAACTDQYALAMACPSFSWATDVAGSTVSSSGLFTAGTTVDAGVVTATSGSVVGTADVDVWREAAALTAIAVSPDPASVEFQETQQFTAACTDQYGLSMTCPSLTWTDTVAGSSVDAAGLFTAGTTEASGDVTAASGAVSGSADVTVYRDAAVLTSLSLSPASATVQATKSATFTPACVDQYGLSMTCPSLTWTTTASGASVSGGVFTAGTTLGSGTVRAESGSVSDTSDVTVSSLVVYVDSIRHYKGSNEQYSFKKSADTVTTKVVLRAVVDGEVVPNVAVTMVTKDSAAATRNTATGTTDSAGVATTAYNLPNSPTGTWKVQVTSVSASWITYQPSSNTSPYDSPLPAERTYEVT